MANPAWDGTISFTVSSTTYNFQISVEDVPRGPKVDVSDRHVPGSGTGTAAAINVVHIGGQHSTNDVGMTGFFPTPLAYFAFEALVGQQGDLIYFDSGDQGLVPATPHGYVAILTKCQRKTRNLTHYAGSSPPASFSETHADLTFKIVGTF